jgi:hypothetical protein
MTVVEDDLPFAAEAILPELVEAASRSGHRTEATIAFDTLSGRALAAATPTALGVSSRSAALLRNGQRAEDAYRRRGRDHGCVAERSPLTSAAAPRTAPQTQYSLPELCSAGRLPDLPSPIRVTRA